MPTTIAVTSTLPAEAEFAARLARDLKIDFLSGPLRYRSHQASRRNELLARAIGLKPKDDPYVIDATAGLGRDSFILATLGFHVTLLERSPVLHALLEDALRRASQDPQVAPAIQRMRLIHVDAISWLARHAIEAKPDVIYLDPMFPERKKLASPGKEMVTLHNLLGSDKDSIELMQAALTCATKRVVIKRPRLAPNIIERAPNFTLRGKSSRFDVYLV